MTRKAWLFVSLTVALVLATVGFGLFNSSVAAQASFTGEWTAKPASNDSKINLSFERRNDSSGKQQYGETYEYSDLQGLTRQEVLNGGAVRFSLVREAGTIECEGSFHDRKGSGTFRFTGSQAFLAAMKSRGFDFEKSDRSNREHPREDRLFAATTLNVTTALADDLRSAGFTLDVDDLFKAAIFKVDSAFMREMKATGYPNLTMEDLVKARIFKIDARFVSEATRMGFDKQPFENLVKLSIFKVTPEFLAEVHSEGLTSLSVEEVVKLKIFNIDGEFIRQAKAEGVPLNVEKLVQRKLGVQRASRRAI